jgi:hypothetical protein
VESAGALPIKKHIPQRILKTSMKQEVRMSIETWRRMKEIPQPNRRLIEQKRPPRHRLNPPPTTDESGAALLINQKKSVTATRNGNTES